MLILLQETTLFQDENKSNFIAIFLATNTQMIITMYIIE